jgi:16S rRNA (cytosine967-C5)-methyltransferase
MAISPARAAAFDILSRVEREDAFASELLHSPKQPSLSRADHALVTELVMGVLRWQSLLDSRIAQSSSLGLGKIDVEVLIALRIGAYQLLFLERIPPSAAVNESVELVKRARKRSAVPFANAVLRKLDRQPKNTQAIREAIDRADTVESLASSSAHPEWLVKRWAQTFGLDAAKSICLSNQSVPQTTIRLRKPEGEAELKSACVEVMPGTLLTSARRIAVGDVTHTAAFREGRIAIQDEASQLVAMLASVGARLLDCCAAPGGKTSILADRNPQALVVAAELHPHRARLLRRLVNQKNAAVIAANANHLPFLIDFQSVLADVPCSGTGTLGRNPEIKWRIKPDDLKNLQSRQVGILASAMSQVAPGGTLVYSTCSLEREENDSVVEEALAVNPDFRRQDCRAALLNLKREGELVVDNIDTLLDGPYLRTLPGVLPVDGFFAAILTKEK